ncbi:MAG: hypothetical protein ACXWC4_00715 [Telluria sp.]
MKKFIELLLVTLLSHVSASALATEPAGSQAKALKPLMADDFKAEGSKNNKAAPGVRDHLHLKPVTAEEFKAGPTKNSKLGPGIRDHLNLKPVTADEFKQAAGTPHQ